MPDDRLIVLNKDEDSISIVDPDSGDTVNRIETEFNPHEVAVGPDDEEIYVTCSLGNSLLVIDTDTWDIVQHFEHDHFEFPHGLAVRESADELWLASTYSSRLFVFDIGNWGVDLLADFETFQDKSHMVALTPDEQTVFVANIGSDNVTVIDAASRELLDVIDVGEGPEGIEVHPDGALLVANQDDSRLTVIDPDTLEETGQALLGDTPIRVVSSPNGRYVFVPNREGNDVSVIDTRHERDDEVRPWEIARIPVGIWPGGTVFDPDGRRAFVANNKTNDISVVDADSWIETDRYGVGLHPDGIAYLSR